MIFSENNITAITVALITGILSPLCLQIFNYYSNKRKDKMKHSLDDKSSVQNEESIISKLESIKEKYNCDRVWIGEFHNGTKTYSGKSFQKFFIDLIINLYFQFCGCQYFLNIFKINFLFSIS